MLAVSVALLYIRQEQAVSKATMTNLNHITAANLHNDYNLDLKLLAMIYNIWNHYKSKVIDKVNDIINNYFSWINLNRYYFNVNVKK